MGKTLLGRDESTSLHVSCEDLIWKVAGKPSPEAGRGLAAQLLGLCLKPMAGRGGARGGSSGLLRQSSCREAGLPVPWQQNREQGLICFVDEQLLRN